MLPSSHPSLVIKFLKGFCGMGLRGFREIKTGSSSLEGSALIIILLLMVMLIALPMAFFIQCTAQRMTTNVDATIWTETVLAQGAIESIMSDLAQEIVAGSSPWTNVVTNVPKGMVYTNLIYYPTIPMNMVPALAFSTSTNGVVPGLENLIKRSAYGVTNYPGGSALAVNSSSTNPSLNGRFVTMAQWNQHLLLARANTNSSTDPTPTNSFIPPDWIQVARDGSKPTNWSTNLCWAITNLTTVTGRYAYAMYEEGGLLDANVAGYPAALTNQSPLPVCDKAGTYFADLTQIGLDTNQINALVAWRNYVTASATGAFPNYTIPDNGTNYGMSILGNNNGFMAIYSTNTVSCSNSLGFATDHQFSSRQALIAFLEACEPSKAAAAMNALRYLGNFSRTTGQPSFAPSTNRPRVLSLANGGNNTNAYTNDDTINPAFLSVSVNSNSFYRNDNSSAHPDAALVGDPLVKKHFPLNLISWVTYAGPSSNNPSLWAPYTNAGIPTSLLSRGSSNNVGGYFGLHWTNNSNKTNDYFWVYRPGVNQPILTLAQVQAQGREADFFELLKASITVGSLGKAYTYTGAASNSNAWTTPVGYNEVYDNWTDAQIIQIGANIIAQTQPGNYPVRIQFSDGITFGGATVEIRGVQDLPYLYRIREGKVMLTNSSPSVGSLPMVNTNGTNFISGGSGIVLQEPEIWNPHAMRSAITTNAGPTSFRLLALSTDPLTLATNLATNSQIFPSTTSYTIGEVWNTNGTVSATNTNIGTVAGTSNSSTNLNTNNAIITFSIPANRQDLFREPTLLITPNFPSGSTNAGPTFALSSTLSGGAYQYAAVGVTGRTNFIGIPMGIIPMAFTNTMSKGAIGTNSSTNVPAAATNGIYPTGYVTYQTNGSYGLPSVTYLLQYQDTNNNWVTYDEKFVSVANSTNGYSTPNSGTNTASTNLSFTYNLNKTFFGDSNHPTWSKNAIGSEWSVVAFDPRSSRFGMQFSGCGGSTNSSYSFPLGAALGLYATNYAPLYTAGWAVPIGTATNSTAMQYAAQQNAVLTCRPDIYGGMVLSSTSSGPTAAGWYPGGSASVVRPGMIAQNNPSVTATTTWRFNNDSNAPAFVNQYFADPDGVVRRGMGAYVPYTTAFPASNPPSSSNFPSGIPMLPAHQFDNLGNASPITANLSANANEYLSRPMIVNRPFRSVAELCYTHSGTPWRNLDCTIPEGGSIALLDVFCMQDTTDNVALTAGMVNLNTRQPLVLQAILAGAYKDDFNPTNPLVNSLLSTNLAAAVAKALVYRTTQTNAPYGPLQNVSELVGKFYTNTLVGNNYYNGSLSYIGFSDDSSTTATNDLTSALLNSAVAIDPEQRIQRLRESTIRALSATGQTRVWNIMIDLVVQSGRYPTTATGFNQFVVDGQIHYWVHLAIDRLTGKLLDRRVETVKE